MEDLAQVTVYALYLWVAASLLWMWRSVLRNRRARKLAADRHEAEDWSSETLTDQDEMMSDITTSSTSASSSSMTDANLDLRSDSAASDGSASTDESASVPDPTTEGSQEKAKAELAMAAAAKESNNGAPPGLLPGEPEDSSKPTEKPPTTAKGSDSGNPDSSQPGTVPAATKPDQPSTIADHLGGIRLPYDLLPMVPNGEKASDQRVSLVSDGAQPEVVGAAIADELERLGYSIKTLATDEAIAVRENQTLGLQIHPDASELSNEDGLRFPEAVAGSVAIDLWVK